jgi:hypothetical protein
MSFELRTPFGRGDAPTAVICRRGQGSPAIGHSLAVVNRAGRSNSKLKTENSKLRRGASHLHRLYIRLDI